MLARCKVGRGLKGGNISIDLHALVVEKLTASETWTRSLTPPGWFGAWALVEDILFGGLEVEVEREREADFIGKRW